MAFKLIIFCAVIVALAEANFVFPHFQFPEIKMPPMPKMNFAPLLSVEDIINQNKKLLNSNSHYNVAAVKSHTKTEIGEDGKPITTGGTQLYSDNNGKVHNLVFDDSPDSEKDSSAKPQKDSPKKSTKKGEPKVATPEVPITDPNDFLSGITSFAGTGNNGAGAAAFSSAFGGGGIKSQSFATSSGGGFATSSSSMSSTSTSSSFSDINGKKSGSGASSSSSIVNGVGGGDSFVYSMSS